MATPTFDGRSPFRATWFLVYPFIRRSSSVPSGAKWIPSTPVGNGFRVRLPCNFQPKRGIGVSSRANLKVASGAPKGHEFQYPNLRTSEFEEIKRSTNHFCPKMYSPGTVVFSTKSETHGSLITWSELDHPRVGLWSGDIGRMIATIWVVRPHQQFCVGENHTSSPDEHKPYARIDTSIGLNPCHVKPQKKLAMPIGCESVKVGA